MDVAEELLDVDHTIDRAYVERRLDDWRMRVGNLYADIRAWLPAAWSMVDGPAVPILEDLMLRFDVPQQMIPTKTLLRDGTKAGRLEPRGLWIIGANGRVDIVLPNAHYIVVDRTDSFEAPNWQVASILARREQRPLNRDLVQQIFV